MTPRVSVIIPNYNHGRYLRQRIESVLRQTYQDFELIILDDCSSDASREIINEYAGKPRVGQIIFNNENSGSPFKQWEKGIAVAKGEWVWIAESDDYADERFLEILITSFEENSNVGLAYCDSRIVTDDGIPSETFATIKNKKFSTRRWSENYRNSGADEIENYLLPGGTINNTSAVLFNKAKLQNANIFDLPLRYIGDKYAFIKVLAQSDVVYVKEALNYYRDPFNIKRPDEFIFYFYEQFLVFDWAWRNMNITNRKKFYEGFYTNTGSSVVRGWTKTKRSLYKRLIRVNSQLLIKSVWHNFWQSFNSVVARTRS